MGCEGSASTIQKYLTRFPVIYWVVEKGELCTFINPQQYVDDLQEHLEYYTLPELIADLNCVHRVAGNVTINNYQAIRWI